MTPPHDHDPVPAPAPAPAPAREARLRALVEALCSEPCAGRAPGTAEGRAAREIVVAAFAGAGLEPSGDAGTFLLAVPGCGGANVIGRVAGSGALADRAVLVGAHYDHLGRASGGRVYWGADDNAAAVAILVDVASRLARAGAAGGGAARQAILCAFDSEEPPYFMTGEMGSQEYVRRPTVPLDRIDLMVCMDLVGHAFGPPALPDDVRASLFVLGAEKSAGTGALVDAAAARARGVHPRRVGIHVIPPLSDYHAFAEAGVPFLFLTCGRWQHYHQPTDTPEKLDYPKMRATADFLADVVEQARRAPGPRRFDPEGQDDVATAESLRALVARLAPLSEAAAATLPLAEDLVTRARSPAGLGDRGRDLVTMLAGELESALSAT